MAKRSIVPFGPQHPVLPEPVHLDLVLEDETVVGRSRASAISTEDLKNWLRKEISSSIRMLPRGSAGSAAADTVLATAWQWKRS